MAKTVTRTLERNQATFNWFLPKHFGQAKQSSNVGRVRWTITLKTEILPDACFRGYHPPS